MNISNNHKFIMDNIVKDFPGVRALDHVQFKLEPGEIHALVGANGAGKSTLMKVLAGVYPDYEGEISINGRTIKLTNPRQALDLGIAVIYQEFNLVSHLTVAENIMLGQEPRRKDGVVTFLNWKSLKKNARELLKDLSFDLPVDKKVFELGVADQQLVQIAKAIAWDAEILVMDEPTARLSRSERDNLFEIMRRLQKRGTSLIYISHFLEEVFIIAERVTILRDGKNVGTFEIDKIDNEGLIKKMLGHKVDMTEKRESAVKDEVVLRVENLSQLGKFQDITFNLRAGEVLGIAGLVGSGRTELARAIFGAEKRKSITGKIEVNNNSYSPSSPKKAIKKGIALLPEDRKQQGLVLVRPVKENISIVVTGDLKKGPLLDLKARDELVKQQIKQMDIKCASSNVQVKTLSGGNQQKVVLAKWLAANTDIIIMDQPTAGIDVGTKEEIYQLIGNLADEKKAIIVISDDPNELARISDRILVMRKGRIVKEIDDNITTEEVLAVVTAEY
ncbi:MAG TPA: sugar ABC transporter ATP-binding protein [Clostridia bacterium]|nr:sugar ABC transporter ATP-binding protein [Clostridia bacterium]